MSARPSKARPTTRRPLRLRAPEDWALLARRTGAFDREPRLPRAPPAGGRRFTVVVTVATTLTPAPAATQGTETDPLPRNRWESPARGRRSAEPGRTGARGLGQGCEVRRPAD